MIRLLHKKKLKDRKKSSNFCTSGTRLIVRTNRGLTKNWEDSKRNRQKTHEWERQDARVYSPTIRNKELRGSGRESD